MRNSDSEVTKSFNFDSDFFKIPIPHAHAPTHPIGGKLFKTSPRESNWSWLVSRWAKTTRVLDLWSGAEILIYIRSKKLPATGTSISSGGCVSGVIVRPLVQTIPMKQICKKNNVAFFAIHKLSLKKKTFIFKARKIKFLRKHWSRIVSLSLRGWWQRPQVDS